MNKPKNVSDEIAACYRILEIHPDASDDALKLAYREQVKVWHPDRFPNDAKFQKRANEKTRQINEAYRRILAHRSDSESRAEAAAAATTAPEEAFQDEARVRAEEQCRTKEQSGPAGKAAAKVRPGTAGPESEPQFGWVFVLALLGMMLVLLTPKCSPEKHLEEVRTVAQTNAIPTNAPSPQDRLQGIQGIRTMAETGYVWAQVGLGMSYDTGEGVPQNFAKAFDWYSRAAERGNDFAQNNLGTMYESGRGVPQDLVKAYTYYSLSAAQGNAWGKTNRDRLLKNLTADQIAEGQSRAAAFVPSK